MSASASMKVNMKKLSVHEIEEWATYANRHHVLKEVDDLICRRLGLERGGFGYGYTVSGFAGIGLATDATLAYSPVKVTILRQWRFDTLKKCKGKKVIKMNAIKDVSAAIRLTTQQIRQRFEWQANRAGTQGKWKLMASQGDIMDYVSLKSRVTGMPVEIHVAATVTNLRATTGSTSFFINTNTSDHETIERAFLTESNESGWVFNEIFGGTGHAKKEDHTAFRRCFDENRINILGPLQDLWISRDWLGGSPQSRAAFKFVWTLMCEAVKSDESGLESIPAWQTLAMIVSNVVVEQGRTSRGQLAWDTIADKSIEKLMNICKDVLSPHGRPYMLTWTAMEAGRHGDECRNYLYEIQWPSYVEKWMRRERKRDSIVLNINDPLVSAATAWVGSFESKGKFCEYGDLLDTFKGFPFHELVNRSVEFVEEGKYLVVKRRQKLVNQQQRQVQQQRLDVHLTRSQPAVPSPQQQHKRQASESHVLMPNIMASVSSSSQGSFMMPESETASSIIGMPSASLVSPISPPRILVTPPRANSVVEAPSFVPSSMPAKAQPTPTPFDPLSTVTNSSLAAHEAILAQLQEQEKELRNNLLIAQMKVKQLGLTSLSSALLPITSTTSSSDARSVRSNSNSVVTPPQTSMKPGNAKRVTSPLVLGSSPFNFSNIQFPISVQQMPMQPRWSA